MREDDSFILRTADDSEEDCRRFCSMFNSLYTRKVDADYYRWQFFETPFPTVLSFAFAQNGNFAGCYGFQILPTGAGIKVARALDIMIAPEFQGKGLFRKLASYAESQAAEHSPAALLVVANKRAEPAYTFGLGWTLTTSLKTYTAPAIEYASHSSEADIVPIRDWSVVSEVLSAKSGRSELPISIYGDAEYFDWRYTRCPWHDYEAFSYIQDGVPRGYVIVKRFVDPVKENSYGDIVDIAWDQRDEIPARELLRFALRHFQRMGVDRAAMWLHTNTELDAFGARAGFVPTSSERYFCCKVLDPAWKTLEEPTSWYLKMSDSEIY